MPLFSYPEKVIYYSETNPSQAPVLPGSGHSFSFISCQHPQTLPIVCTRPLGFACLHMHSITHVIGYVCSVLSPSLLLEFHSRLWYMSLDNLSLGRSYQYFQVGFPQVLGICMILSWYLYPKSYYPIHLLIIH